MAKIRSVAICAGDGSGLAGILLDIHFYNGQSLLLPLKSRQTDPAFLRLYQEGTLFNPKTDGNRVYWANGASLTLDEILELLTSETDGDSAVR
jgi:hypothetical protein